MSDEERQPHQPYVPASKELSEFTLKAVILGAIFGVVFGAANAYLGLKAGLTISTSIPIAVITVAAFRGLKGMGVGSSILEANMAQTIGSASSSVASGVIFTLPALFLWGFAPGLLQMTMLAMFGGLLGVLFMIPLRPFLIAKEHGKLPYPEGTACAEVLKATETGGSGARSVFFGLGAGAIFKGLTNWAHLFPGGVWFNIPFLNKGRIGTDISAALLGVGYILGPKVGAIMVGGGLLSSLVLIPAIAYWGADRAEPLYPETIKAIADMAPGELWTRYVRYIGAGAVATGGLITLIRSIPMMLASFRVGASQLKQRLGSSDEESVPRTNRDLPLSFVGVAVSFLAILMAGIPTVFGALGDLPVRLVAAAMVVICSFFFVTVSSRIVGMVGVTSNPTSGMTIASLLATASVFLLFGWTGDIGKVAALTVGCVIAISASIAGDTSQDLKTGFLLGATPRRQQIGELVGVLTCAVAICWTVIYLDKGLEFGSTDLPAPQATLMKVVIEGVLEQSLPWTLVGIGAGIAILAELCRIPSLPFAVGVYLPVSTMVPVFLGGLLRSWMEKSAKTPEEAESRKSNGTLFGSGLVGGAGLIGVLIAAMAAKLGHAPEGIGVDWAGDWSRLVALAAFGMLAMLFIRVIRSKAS